MNVLPYGASALLLEPGDGAVLPLAAACADLDGVAEVVPAARTVLVVLDSPAAERSVRSAVLALDVDAFATDATGADEIVLDVVYDGADLASTAAELGLDADGLVRAHGAATYLVAFCGFVPGFAYLSALPEELRVSRLDSPRTRVPAGSVGIAGEFTGVYPRDSPGGWRLLGTTGATLWDRHRTPPALLSPGTSVRFRATSG